MINELKYDFGLRNLQFQHVSHIINVKIWITFFFSIKHLKTM